MFLGVCYLYRGFLSIVIKILFEEKALVVSYGINITIRSHIVKASDIGVNISQARSTALGTFYSWSLILCVFYKFKRPIIIK